MSNNYNIIPIGWVRNTKTSIHIDIEPKFTDALLGIRDFSHLMVFYWFHENDTPKGRSMLRVHPRANPDNPLYGVFATHSPKRPNLIAMTVCQLLKVDQNRLFIDNIDARNGSPVIDLKCYIPIEPDGGAVKVPEWV
jgi:tRNA-Thr(GGU) m(6)t(6)A37 methyltransferase TsaA